MKKFKEFVTSGYYLLLNLVVGFVGGLIIGTSAIDSKFTWIPALFFFSMFVVWLIGMNKKWFTASGK